MDREELEAVALGGKHIARQTIQIKRNDALLRELEKLRA
jgi:hypothetical protein